MIARLYGTLVETDGNQAILDVNGVGYEIWATSRDLLKWNAETEPLTIYISTQVREDSITLYGFPDLVHRKGFDIMLSVSGVGPKVALSALDAMDMSTLRTAVETDDVRTLTSISGVGKKTAQRIALELKGKLPVGFSAPGASPQAPTVAKPRTVDPLELALERLGYNKTEIERTRTRLLAAGVPEDAPVAQRLKAALSNLYQDGRS